MNDQAVVVGIDGSANAEAAAAYGAWEARRRHRPLRLVHGLVPVPQFGVAPTLPSVTEALVSRARSLVAQAGEKVHGRDPELPVTTAVIAGSPAGVLLDEASRADLVVVGSRGTGGFASLLVGSVAAQVATHAPVPVVVVRDSAAVPEPGPVVVGVDGSAGSAAALELAFDEAAARGSDLVAVYAWGVPPGGNLGPIMPGQYDAEQAREEGGRLLAEALAGWSDKYPGTPVHRRAIHSFNPLKTILEESESASLIVVGARSHGGFLGLLLGSVADGLLRNSPRSLAIARPASGTR